MNKRNLLFAISLCLCLSNSYFINLNSECFFKSCVTCKDCSSCDDIENPFGKTFFSIRPQDSNSARRILNYANSSRLFLGESKKQTAFNVTFEFQKSFNNTGLAKWFSFNNKKCMTIGTPGPGLTFDINGNQLGIGTPDLEPGLIGNVCLNPQITNFIADFEFDLNLDDFLCGLWSRLSIPVVRTQTELGLCGIPGTSPTATFPGGFYVLNCAETPSPFSSVLEAFKGDKSVGVIPKLSFGKFSNKKMVKSGIAGFAVDMAYDCFRNDRGRFAIGGHIVCPTGNKPTGEFVFEPIIGANKSWQLGAIFTGSYDFCTPDLNKNLTIFFDATISHLFKAKQTRVFALKNKPGSQFLLAKTFGPFNTTIGADRLANVLAGETKIGADFMFDGSLMFQYKYCNYSINLGYNLWFRSKEKRSEKVCFNNFSDEGFGLKGDLPLSQEQIIIECPELVIECVPNNQTASGSTISVSSPADSVQTTLKTSDIDFCAPLHPQALSNKIFGSIGYQVDSCKMPVLFNFGGEIEFSPNNKAINQWGIFLNAEISL